MTPGERRVLELACRNDGCSKEYFDTFRGLLQIAKNLVWSGHLAIRGSKLVLTQLGQERLEGGG